MSENEPEKPRKGWGCLMWAVAGAAVVLFLPLLIPVYGLTTVRAQQMKAGSNVRQMVGLLMTYAADNSGIYPDVLMETEGLTANAVFRKLIVEGYAQDEVSSAVLIPGLFLTRNWDLLQTIPEPWKQVRITG